MNLLFITVHMGGGAGKAIAGMASQCIRRHNDVSIALLERPENVTHVHTALGSGVHIYIVPSDEELAKIMGESDVAILNWWGHPLGVKFIMRISDVPCRLLLWGHVNGCVYPYLPFRFLNKFSGIMFTSDYSLENPYWTEEEQKQISCKSAVVYGMGDYDPHGFPEKESYQMGSRFIVGYVGTLDYAKLNRDFLDYCAACAERIPDIEFWLVGNLGRELEKQIKDRDMEKYFNILGYVADTSALFPQFDVFGYLLEEESYATTENALLEAMAYALPIVVLGNPVEKHIIYEGVNGFLVRSYKEYADKLEELYCSGQKRKIIGQKARSFAGKKYNSDDNADKFLDLCKKNKDLEKSSYDFSDLWGNDIFTAFCFFAGQDGEYFRNYAGTHGDRQQAKACKRIYKGKEKGSVRQYASYFPESREFKEIIDLWGEKSDGY